MQKLHDDDGCMHAFKFFKIFQIFRMLQATTLKRNLVPRFGEASKRDGFGVSGWLPPLKEICVGCLALLCPFTEVSEV